MKRFLAPVNKFNDWIAIRANQLFSTMVCFWVFLLITLIPLKWPVTMPFLQYLSSGILQLCSLPLLAVGTVLAAKSSDKLAQEQHAAVIESHEEIKKLIAEDDQIEARLDRIEALLAKLVPTTESLSKTCDKNICDCK
jgi:hypothetical protein